MGYLTTHVLDTANGRPGAGIRVTVERLDDTGAAIVLTEIQTNADGRGDQPLVSGADFVAGQYQLVFDVGGYFADHGPATDTPAFLDDVVIRFGVAQPDAHYHVPLLVSPYGYTTYRGS